VNAVAAPRPPDPIAADHAGRAPVLSVILMSPDTPATQASTVAHLRNQTIRDAIEVVLVCPSLDGADAFAQRHLGDFLAYRFVPSPPTLSLAKQQAMGIAAATAPFVALGEDHCQPSPTWAEQIVKAFNRSDTYVGISPAVHVANDSMLAVASQLIDYTRWTAPVQAGEVPSISSSNATFRRDVILREYGEGLYEMIERGGAIHADLIAKGHRFYLEPEARVYHKNISRLGEVWSLRFNIGRFHAGAEADRAGWSGPRRLAMAAVALLMPIKRYLEINKKLLSRKYPLGPKVLVGLAIGLTMDGLGRVAGYASGEGDSLRQIYHAEFHREPRMHPCERNRNYVAENEPRAVGPGYVDPLAV
jgi:hypothetical protein